MERHKLLLKMLMRDKFPDQTPWIMLRDRSGLIVFRNTTGFSIYKVCVTCNRWLVVDAHLLIWFWATIAISCPIKDPVFGNTLKFWYFLKFQLPAIAVVPIAGLLLHSRSSDPSLQSVVPSQTQSLEIHSSFPSAEWSWQLQSVSLHLSATLCLY